MVSNIKQTITYTYIHLFVDVVIKLFFYQVKFHIRKKKYKNRYIQKIIAYNYEYIIYI